MYECAAVPPVSLMAGRPAPAPGQMRSAASIDSLLSRGVAPDSRLATLTTRAWAVRTAATAAEALCHRAGLLGAPTF